MSGFGCEPKPSSAVGPSLGAAVSQSPPCRLLDRRSHGYALLHGIRALDRRRARPHTARCWTSLHDQHSGYLFTGIPQPTLQINDEATSRSPAMAARGDHDEVEVPQSVGEGLRREVRRRHVVVIGGNCDDHWWPSHSPAVAARNIPVKSSSSLTSNMLLVSASSVTAASSLLVAGRIRIFSYKITPSHQARSAPRNPRRQTICRLDLLLANLSGSAATRVGRSCVVTT